MKECHVQQRAFAMPLTSPAYPLGQSVVVSHGRSMQ